MVLLLIGLVVAACTDPESGESTRDREVGAADATHVSPEELVVPTSSSRPKKLCGLPPPKAGVKLPPVKMGSVHAANEAPMGAALETGGGKWTLINVWASHCEGCLAKMALLKSWGEKLSERLRVTFVSFDDDPAPAVKFLSSQPPSGVRRSYHLGDFGTRLKWMYVIGTSESVPVQILVDTDGVVQCLALRSVEEADFSEIETLVSK